MIGRNYTRAHVFRSPTKPINNLKKEQIFQGGIKAVVWTDCIQTIAMVGSMIVIIVKV